MNIIVVGAGAIGKERIKALEIIGERITCIVDPINNGVDTGKYNWCSNISYCYELDNADWIFICTPHDVTVETVRYIRRYCNNKTVKILVEKPFLGYNYSDLTVNNVGFNYRFFKGVRQLLEDVQNKVFGDLISVNMVLALGDGPGTDKTWRLGPLKAGKGVVIDPGIHLIDLAMLISEGSLEYISDVSNSKFWNTGFIEETHLLATDKNNAMYNIQASKVRWNNQFRIEVNGTEGYGIVEGRNRNYGNQTYRRGKRWGWQSGKSQRESEEIVIGGGIPISRGRSVGNYYDGEDSFLEETKAVLYGCEGIQPGTAEDNKRCLEFTEEEKKEKSYTIYTVPYNFES